MTLIAYSHVRHSEMTLPSQGSRTCFDENTRWRFEEKALLEIRPADRVVHGRIIRRQLLDLLSKLQSAIRVASRYPPANKPGCSARERSGILAPPGYRKRSPAACAARQTPLALNRAAGRGSLAGGRAARAAECAPGLASPGAGRARPTGSRPGRGSEAGVPAASNAALAPAVSAVRMSQVPRGGPAVADFGTRAACPRTAAVASGIFFSPAKLMASASSARHSSGWRLRSFFERNPQAPLKSRCLSL